MSTLKANEILLTQFCKDEEQSLRIINHYRLFVEKLEEIGYV